MKHTWIAAVVFALWAGIAGATTPVQVANGIYASGSHTVVTTTSTTAGDSIFLDLSCSLSNGQGVQTITDNKSNTWVKVQGAYENPSGNNWGASEVWWVQTPTAGVTTVTIANSVGNAYCMAVFIELPGANWSTDQTGTVTSVPTATTATVTASAVNTGTTDFVIAGISTGNSTGAPGTPTTGYTAGTGAASYGQISYRSDASAVTDSATWTWAGASDYASAIASFHTAATCTAKPMLSNGHPVLSSTNIRMSCG